MAKLIPSYDQFRESSSQGDYAGFLKTADFFEDPFELYKRFKGKGPSVLLESAKASEKMGRYSILAKDPFLVFKAKGSKTEVQAHGLSEALSQKPMEILRRLFKNYQSENHLSFPPFAGGAIGYFGYEAKDLFEPRVGRERKDDLGLPDIYLLFFDQGIILDHSNRSLYLFANVRVGQSLKKSYAAAMRKIEALEADLRKCWKQKTAPNRSRPLNRLTDRAASSLSRPAFIKMVKKAKRHIRRGDIYQANLSQRFSFPVRDRSLDIYARLKEVNPSSFFGYLNAGDFQIVSGSPERLVKLENGVLETRPIAGTRARGLTATDDQRLSLDLILNEKERAEHIMLVDLERNDLGRVAEYGSVIVDELMALENYRHVKHIVSNVRGILREGLDAVDVIQSFFPGGTITGAPKIRCMEIIDALEPVVRGPYTGSLGYLSFSGNMDLNIIIRSLVIKDGRAYLNVGAGIVADSDPEREYDETLYKAESVLNAVFGKEETDAFFAERGLASRLS